MAACLAALLITSANQAFGDTASPTDAPVSCPSTDQVYRSGTQPVAGSTAVLFVHGFDSSPDIWAQGGGTPITAQAAALPGITAWTFDYSKTALDWVTDPSIGPRLATAIDCLATATGRPVLVVAHSLGGLATQFAVSQTGSDGALVDTHVAEVITIGTPFQGSLLESIASGGATASLAVSPGVGAAFNALRSECAGLAVSGYQDPCGNLGLELTPAGQGLEYKSAQIAALPPWPTALPVFATAGDMDEGINVGSLRLSVDLGDIPVSLGSATFHDTVGTPFVTTCQNANLFKLVTDSDSLPCYHHNLPHNPEIVAQVMAQIRQFAGPATAGTSDGPFTGRLVWTQKSSSGNPLSGPVAISPGDTYVAGTDGTTMTVWTLPDGKGKDLKDPTYPGYPIDDPVFSADGSVLITTGYQDRAWDPSSGQLANPGFPKPTLSVQVGGTGDMVLDHSAGAKFTYYVYEPEFSGQSKVDTYTLSGTTLTASTSYPLKTFFDTDSHGFLPAINPAATQIVGAIGTSDDAQPEVVDLATGSVVPLPTGANAPGPNVAEAEFSPDGKYLAVVSIQQAPQNKIVLYDTSTWTEAESFPGDVFTFSPDGHTLAVGSATGPGVNLYNVASKQEVGTLNTAGEISSTSRSMAYSPDGKYLAVAQGFAGLQLWAIS